MSEPLSTLTDARQLPLIVIGAGGHTSVLLDLLEGLNRQVLFITDHDPARHGRQMEGVAVRGGDEEVFAHPPAAVRLVNGIGSVTLPEARRRVFERFTREGYQFETLIHPSAVVARSVKLGEGVQIMARATVQTGARIGANSLINTTASIDHDCVVGEHVHVAPGVTLSGNVAVGHTSHLGTGSTVIQSVRLGERVLAGAGAVVVRDVAGNTTVAGVPARPIRSRGVAEAADDRAHASKQAPFNIMLLAAGRRVALLMLLKQSLRTLGQPGQVLASDISRSSSAFQLADLSRLVPSYAAPDCLEKILEICQEHQVRLVVPTIDPDLRFFSEHRATFERAGTQVMVGSPETIRISNDKQAAHDWLVAHGFPTMRQAAADAVLENPGDWRFPLFAKPRYGSSSVGAQTVRSLEALRIVAEPGGYLVQELARGQEYTVDVYVDRDGRCRCTVPRQRLETRGGEVSKGVTVRCEPVQALVRRIAEALPGARGVMNVQVFYDDAAGILEVCEINARFGGGYPLTHEAGAPMVQWMIREALGLPIDARENQWTDGLVMLRYDEAVFVSREDAGLSPTLLHSDASPLPTEF